MSDTWKEKIIKGIFSDMEYTFKQPETVRIGPWLQAVLEHNCSEVFVDLPDVVKIISHAELAEENFPVLIFKFVTKDDQFWSVRCSDRDIIGLLFPKNDSGTYEFDVFTPSNLHPRLEAIAIERFAISVDLDKIDEIIKDAIGGNKNE